MLILMFISSLVFAETPAASDVVKSVESAEKVNSVEVAVPAEKKEEASKVEPKKEASKSKDKSKEEASKKVEEPKDYNEAAETVSLLVKAVQNKNWALVIGLLLTLLVFVANKFGLKDKVGSKAVPWVATGLATATSLGISLANGLPVTDAVSQGVLAGLTAIGGWEMLFKHILGGKKEE